MSEAESADPSVYVVGAVQRTSIVVADALVKVTADGGFGVGDATVNDHWCGVARVFPGALASRAPTPTVTVYVPTVNAVAWEIVRTVSPTVHPVVFVTAGAIVIAATVAAGPIASENVITMFAVPATVVPVGVAETTVGRVLSTWNCALHAFPTSPAVSAASMHTTTLTALIVPGTFHVYTSGEGRLVSRLATTPFPLEDV